MVALSRQSLIFWFADMHMLKRYGLTHPPVICVFGSSLMNSPGGVGGLFTGPDSDRLGVFEMRQGLSGAKRQSRTHEDQRHRCMTRQNWNSIFWKRYLLQSGNRPRTRRRFRRQARLPALWGLPAKPRHRSFQNRTAQTCCWTYTTSTVTTLPLFSKCTRLGLHPDHGRLLGDLNASPFS